MLIKKKKQGVASQRRTVSWTPQDSAYVAWIRHGEEWWVNSSLRSQGGPRILSWRCVRPGEKAASCWFRSHGDSRWMHRLLLRIVSLWHQWWHAYAPRQPDPNRGQWLQLFMWPTDHHSLVSWVPVCLLQSCRNSAQEPPFFQWFAAVVFNCKHNMHLLKQIPIAQKYKE